MFTEPVFSATGFHRSNSASECWQASSGECCLNCKHSRYSSSWRLPAHAVLNTKAATLKPFKHPLPAALPAHAPFKHIVDYICTCSLYAPVVLLVAECPTFAAPCDCNVADTMRPLLVGVSIVFSSLARICRSGVASVLSVACTGLFRRRSTSEPCMSKQCSAAAQPSPG